MMTKNQNWLRIDAPAGWTPVVIRSIQVAVVAFVTLQLKELFDAGAFDTPATAIDAGLIAGATFALNAIHMWVKS